MARPKNQAHRRAEVIAAATRAINDRGIKGLRLKDIAEEAGVAIGTVHYYYPNMDDLVFAVHRSTIESFIDGRRAIVSNQQDVQHALAALIRSGLPVSTEDSTFGLFYELHSLAGRSSAHSDLMSSLWARDVEVYVSVLETGAQQGAFALAAPAREIAVRMVAFEDGLSLQVLSENPAIDVPAAIGVMARYAEEAVGVVLDL